MMDFTTIPPDLSGKDVNCIMLFTVDSLMANTSIRHFYHYTLITFVWVSKDIAVKF